MILARLQDAYGLRVNQLTFLPLGADVNTAVYRVDTDAAVYFLKLRQGDFDEISVLLPRFLSEQGLRWIIAPHPTLTGALWTDLPPYRLILYPFVAGQDGYAAGLTDAQWADFGAALGGIHTTQLPEDLAQRIPRETFSPHWRETVRAFQAKVETRAYSEPSAANMAAFMRENRRLIDYLVTRADQLALALQAQPDPLVLCHADIHPGNLLIAPPDFYIVDWDNPIYALKERDLGLIGGGATWNDPREVALFYHGYASRSPAPLNRAALAYYRYERVIQDIAAFGEQLLLSDEGGENRPQAYAWFTSSFLPGHEIEAAMKIDPH